MALDADVLVTVVELQAMPGMSAVSEGNCQYVLNRANARIKSYLDRQMLKSQSATFYLDGDGSRFLALPEGPLTSLTSVHDDLNRSFASGTSLNLDYVIVEGGYRGASYKDNTKPDWPTRLVLFDEECVFSNGRRNVKVVCAVGYGDAGGYFPVPADLANAFLLLAKHYWMHSDMALQSESVPDYSYSLKGGVSNETTEIPGALKGLLSRYKHLEL